MEGRGVVDQRVLADLDGIAHRGDGRGVDDLRILFQFDLAKILLVIAEIAILPVGRVADQLHIQPVAAHGHFLDLYLALLVGQGEMGNGRVALRVQVHRGEGQRLLGLGVQQGQLDLDIPVALEHIVVHHDDLRLRGHRQHQAGKNNE